MTNRCKGGEPHDYQTRTDEHGNLLDFADCKWEICVRCGDKIRWQKDGQGRVDNVAYLEAHIRNFCQPWGATRKTFIKLYHPQMNRIRICLTCPIDEEVYSQKCGHFIETDYTKKAFKIDQKGSNDKSWRKEIYGV